MSKVKSRKSKCQVYKYLYVAQDTFSNRPKADFWGDGNTTLQEQEESPKIRMTGNFAGIITGAIV